MLVSGAGSAGLAAGLALAMAGLRTACIDPAPLEPPAGESTRTVALLPTSVALLHSLGTWDRLRADAQPITEFRFREAGSRAEAACVRAAEIGARALSWNMLDASLHSALGAAAARTALLQRIQPGRILSLSRRNDCVFALLEDGRRMRARMVVAADGRHSPTRESAGIRIRQWNRGRRAIAFLASSRHAQAHVCTEIHGRQQTAALVPLPDGRAGVVWRDS